MSDDYRTERVYGVTPIHGYGRDAEQHRRHPGGHPPAQPAGPPPEVADAAEILGLQAASLSPEVLAALSGVITELERLRWLDRQHQHREAYLEQVSDRHSVVPCLNRRAFVRELERYLSGPDGHGVLVVIHCRGIEAICGVLGLAAGDGALRHVCSNLVGALRKSDMVGLLGISDFGMVLAGSHIAEAREKVDEVLLRINRQPFTWLGQGVALDIGRGFHVLAPGEGAETALGAADRDRRGLEG